MPDPGWSCGCAGRGGRRRATFPLNNRSSSSGAARGTPAGAAAPPGLRVPSVGPADGRRRKLRRPTLLEAAAVASVGVACCCCAPGGWTSGAAVPQRHSGKPPDSVLGPGPSAGALCADSTSAACAPRGASATGAAGAADVQGRRAGGQVGWRSGSGGGQQGRWGGLVSLLNQKALGTYGQTELAPKRLPTTKFLLPMKHQLSHPAVASSCASFAHFGRTAARTAPGSTRRSHIRRQPAWTRRRVATCHASLPAPCFRAAPQRQQQ